MVRAQTSGNYPGSITFKSLGQTPLRAMRAGMPSATIHEELLTWRAAADLPGALPRDRSFTLSQRTASCNARFVRPPAACTPANFINAAFIYGHATLARDRAWDFSTWVEYLMAKHAYDALIQSQVWLKKRFRKPLDFSLWGGSIYKDLLPEYFGRTHAEKSERWSIDDLQRHGRNAAVVAGICKPQPQDVVSYGFFAAAKQCPIELPPERCRTLIRDLLIDDSRITLPPDHELTSVVRWRFEELIRRKLHQPQQRFTNWLGGGSSNLVQALQASAKSEGYDLTREQVQRALLDLAWWGLPKIAECMEAFMCSFAEALPQPLNDYERKYFDGLFARQDYLGGLTLMLLAGRCWILRPALEAHWEGTESIGVLHRVIYDITEAVHKSREVERAKKAPGRTISTGLQKKAEQPWHYDALHELTRAVLERRGIRCSNCRLRPHAALVPSDDLEPETMKLQPTCDHHGEVGKALVVTFDELRFVAAASGLTRNEVDPFEKKGWRKGRDKSISYFKSPSPEDPKKSDKTV